MVGHKIEVGVDVSPQTLVRRAGTLERSAHLSPQLAEDHFHVKR